MDPGGHWGDFLDKVLARVLVSSRIHLESEPEKELGTTFGIAADLHV